MQRILLNSLPRSAFFRSKNVIATLGVFDEFHLGHRWLLRNLANHAKENDAVSLQILLRPRPSEALGFSKRPYVTSVLEALRESRMLGIDHAGVLGFTSRVAVVSSEDFLQWALARLNVRQLWLGDGAMLGRGPAGSGAGLQAVAERLGIDLKFVWSKEDASDRLIAGSLEAGNIETVTAARGAALGVVGALSEWIALDATLGYWAVVLPEMQLLPSSGWFHVDVGFWDGAPSLYPAFLEIVRSEDCLIKRGRLFFKSHTPKGPLRLRNQVLRIQINANAMGTILTSLHAHAMQQ